MDTNQLHDFFNGSAQPKEVEEIIDWLAQSDKHREELLSERTFFDALQLSDDGKRHLQPTPKPTLANRVTMEILKIVLLVVGITAIGHIIYMRKLNEIYTTTNTVVAPPGQRVNLLLSDGTEVWLNARSKLTYSAYMKGTVAEVELDGEAYFDLPNYASQSLIVHTRHYDLHLQGARCNVASYPEKDAFIVALMEGTLRVWNQNSPENSVEVLPRQQATGTDGRLSTSPILDEEAYRWREGWISLKNVSFQELAMQFENSYGIDIIFENDRVASLVLSGQFRVADGIDYALRELQKKNRFTYERKNGDSVIYIR